MKTTKEKINEVPGKHTYWSRIHFESDDLQNRTTVLVNVSHEHLRDKFRAENYKDNLNEWYEGVVKKWEEKGDDIFEKEVHYDVYANTPEGKRNGFNFLSNVRP